MSQSPVERIVEILLENKSYNLRLTDSDNVTRPGNSTFFSPLTFQGWLLSNCPSNQTLLSAVNAATLAAMNVGKTNVDYAEVLDLVRSRLIKQKESVPLDSLPPTEASHGVPLSQVTLVKLNMEKGTGLVQFGPGMDWEPVDFNDFIAQVRFDYSDKRYKEALAEWISHNSSPYVPVMDPYISPGQQQKTKAKLRRFNVYVRPTYLRDWDVASDFNREVPTEILNYLEKLFPEEKERDYILCRLYHVVASRSAVVLVLAGPPKTGKTTYMELERALVGFENFRTLSVKQDQEKFDGYLGVARLIHRDEPNLTRDLVERLKNNVNDMIGTSEKNIQTVKQKPFKNHCSFTIAMNIAGKRFELEFEDRKFYVPRIAEPPEDGSSPYPLEEYEGIRNAMTNVEKLRDLYAYLYRYYKDATHSPDAPKTESFYRLCHLKLGADKLGIVEAASNQSIGTFFPPCRRNSPLGAKNARGFIAEYEQQLGITLGNISGRGTDWTFTASPTLTESERARLAWFLSIHDEDGFDKEVTGI